jgi:hypothetical protein
MRMLRRLAAVLPAAALAAVLGASPALATSGAHFFAGTGGSVTDSGALAVTIDEAGVGQALVSYDLAWTATADYGCVNGGGNHPQAANKETVSAGGDVTFSESPVNGRVHAAFTVPGTPPGPGSFACPSGQDLVLADVSYSATLTDTTNGAAAGVSASRVFLTFRR